MSFRANVLRIMIASPSDMAEARKIVTEEIHRWNDANAFARRLVLLPVKWETHSTPQLGEHPQTIINRQILDEADILVGIFGTRIGTPTDSHVSGTVEEIKKHVAAGKTAMIYFSDAPVHPSTIKADQYASVQAFRLDCQRTGLYATFNSADAFRSDFSQHVNMELNKPRYLWMEAPDEESSSLGPDASRLVKAAGRNEQGMAVIVSSLSGYSLQVGGDVFMDGSARSTAKWRGVMKDLEQRNIFEQRGEGVYFLTDEGFALADSLLALEPTHVELNILEGEYLAIKSSRSIRLSKLEFLVTPGVCIFTQSLSSEGEDAKIQISSEGLGTLYGHPRPDRHPNNRSGPAQLRLSAFVNGSPIILTLSVFLQMKTVEDRSLVSLTGADSFDF